MPIAIHTQPIKKTRERMYLAHRVTGIGAGGPYRALFPKYEYRVRFSVVTGTCVQTVAKYP